MLKPAVRCTCDAPGTLPALPLSLAHGLPAFCIHPHSSILLSPFHQATKSLTSNTMMVKFADAAMVILSSPEQSMYCAIQPTQLSFIFPRRDTSSCLCLLRLQAHKALRICLMPSDGVPWASAWYAEATGHGSAEWISGCPTFAPLCRRRPGSSEFVPAVFVQQCDMLRVQQAWLLRTLRLA